MCICQIYMKICQKLHVSLSEAAYMFVTHWMSTFKNLQVDLLKAAFTFFRKFTFIYQKNIWICQIFGFLILIFQKLNMTFFYVTYLITIHCNTVLLQPMIVYLICNVRCEHSLDICQQFIGEAKQPIKLLKLSTKLLLQNIV